MLRRRRTPFSSMTTYAISVYKKAWAWSVMHTVRNRLDLSGRSNWFIRCKSSLAIDEVRCEDGVD